MSYTSPLTPQFIYQISRISEALGRWAAVEGAMSPGLRRENRIRAIQASLANVNNSLKMTQPDLPNNSSQRYVRV